MLDQSDTELLQSFQHLGPLLMQASQYMREKDEEPLNKKLKQEPVGVDKAAMPPSQQNKALLTLIHHLAKVVLQHDRAIQMDRKQDSFVIFAQVSAEGALPLLTLKAKEWKDMTEKTTTLRTYLLKHLILEIQQRAIKLSQSSQGTQLWDVAVSKGVILQDGSWPFQQWCHTEKKLTKSHRAPLPMSRTLKDLQFMVDLLTDNDHVMRSHSLRPQSQCGADATAQHARGRSLETLSSAESVHPMGTHGPELEAAQPTSQQTSAAAGTADQHPGDGTQRTRQGEDENQGHSSSVARDPSTGGCKADTWQHGPYVLCQRRLHLLFVVGPEQTQFHHYRLGTSTCFVS